MLKEHNEYRQQVLHEKEAQLIEFEKYRSHLDKTYKQMNKKYQTALEEERVSNQRKVNKLESMWKLKLEQSESNSSRKDSLIEELRKKINDCEREKYEVIEESTRMLC